ncbi:MAG: CopD family protein [Proteobacteria bacterium]|nr:CopD family protein [Pseudomonadota bacterium]
METYLILKTLHLISMVAWFAGLFYLPRIFVYLAESPPAAHPTLHTMARKLSHYIMLPAAAATWAFGLALMLSQPYLLQQGWLHAKLGLVLLLTAYQVSLEFFRLQLLQNPKTRSGKFFRYYNEVPTLLLITIITLAVFKPF